MKLDKCKNVSNPGEAESNQETAAPSPKLQGDGEGFEEGEGEAPREAPREVRHNLPSPVQADWVDNEDSVEGEHRSEPPNFIWGNRSGVEFCEKVSKGYDEVVQWRRNLFLLPIGKVAKSFIQETADLFESYASKSTLESIALKACMLMHVLLLHKPSQKSKAKDHANHFRRRLTLWKAGDLDALLIEGRCIQAHLPKSELRTANESVSRAISKMMFAGNVRGALNYLSRHTSGTPLKMDDIITTNDGSTKTVKDVLLSLHPEGQPADPTALLDKALPNALPMDPVMFECLNGDVIKNVALHSKDLLDHREWKL